MSSHHRLPLDPRHEDIVFHKNIRRIVLSDHVLTPDEVGQRNVDDGEARSNDIGIEFACDGPLLFVPWTSIAWVYYKQPKETA